MLFKICIVQILIYLFIIPIIRLIVSDFDLAYDFIISFVFLGFFILGSYFVRSKTVKHNTSSIRFSFISEINKKWFIFPVFVMVCAYISFAYELYNPRIGTDEAAQRIASVPSIFILIFRTLGITLPLFISLTLREFFETKNRLHFRFIATLSLLMVSFFLIGGSASRSALGLYLLISIIIIQNELPIPKLKSLGIRLAGIAVIAYISVTFFRVASGDSREATEYISAEILQRLDGLEIASSLINKYGYHITGINPMSVLNPIISSIPFFDAAVALKAAALTTVKATIMLQEMDSSLRDINSFLILDVYYWGGFLWLILVAFVSGILVRNADVRIGFSKGRIYHFFLMAVIINFGVMERESISLMLGVFRDTLILIFSSYIFLRRSKPTI